MLLRAFGKNGFKVCSNRHILHNQVLRFDRASSSFLLHAMVMMYLTSSLREFYRLIGYSFVDDPDSRTGSVGPESFIKSYSQPPLSVVIFDDPNRKFDHANVSPRFTPWVDGHSEVQYNTTADQKAPVLKNVKTSDDLLKRCE